MDKKIKLQLALDLDSLDRALSIAEKIKEFVDIIEIGTPLIKKYGIASVKKARETFNFMIVPMMMEPVWLMKLHQVALRKFPALF